MGPKLKECLPWQYGTDWLAEGNDDNGEGPGIGARRREDRAGLLAHGKPKRKSLLQNSPMDY